MVRTLPVVPVFGDGLLSARAGGGGGGCRQYRCQPWPSPMPLDKPFIAVAGKVVTFTMSYSILSVRCTSAPQGDQGAPAALAGQAAAGPSAGGPGLSPDRSISCRCCWPEISAILIPGKHFSVSTVVLWRMVCVEL